ncbi:sigma-54-dependent transcriptional regulator [Halobacillus massiliensis]|uniref:sigma-54-dependent transcriptional regulator n=1 Tax=Halobacillus massiliensis TaxID=1926286 RepID=UPI0009E23453|nr:sigma-54-dependent transcriptional regulator [Halobacillus massiliensis]
MKRIQLIESTLKDLYESKRKGITAQEISEYLQIDRSNVSRDLNMLVKEGRLKKSKKKPVLFEPIEPGRSLDFGTTKLDFFARGNPSMFSIVEKGKAAILYPPFGMNMLFLGETGVGKSMMAELMYDYAVEIGKLNGEAPFISFNCADYANNPQLLVSQIFGRKKGAYTGAESDQKGFIEQAHEGILFLDEVHRLPPEGQEILFTYIDKGVFRRLGETEQERKSQVLIIAATTEDPSSSLLRAFTRRIPMTLTIPNLDNRTLEERFHLISMFLKQESGRLKTTIKVSVNSIRAFLSYRCENNIGQLKSDVQIVCAKAYADFIIKKKKEIIITTTDLPSHILNGLYTQVEHRKLWVSLNNIKERFFEYNAETFEKQMEYPLPGETIYKMIDKKLHMLEEEKIEMNEIEKEMEKDIDNYFTNFVSHRSHNNNRLEFIISEDTLELTKKLIKFSEKRLNTNWGKKVFYAFAIHISNMLERLQLGLPIYNPRLEQIKLQYPGVFQVALECIEMMNEHFDTNIPEDEAGFITLFFVYDEYESQYNDNKTRVIVLTHGSGTASSLVATANELLNTSYAIPVNARLDERPQEVLERLKEILRKDKRKLDTLFLVDMGSLTTFASEIEKDLGIKTRSISRVSTIHVLEATRKAMLGYSLEELYEDIKKLNQNERPNKTIEAEQNSREKKLAILTVCLTGEGTANTIKEILENKLNYKQADLEVLPVNIVGEESITKRIKAIEEEYKVICIVSSFKITTDIPQFNLYSVLNMESLKDINSLIKDATTYLHLSEFMEQHVEIPGIKVKDLIADIMHFNHEMEKFLNVRYDLNVLIGFSLHLCGLFERIKKGEERVKFLESEEEIINNTVLIQRTQMIFDRSFLKYKIKIELNDIYYIIKMYLKQMEEKRGNIEV